jgi:hypothetical protein
MLAIYETEADFSARTDPHREAFWGAWRADHQALVAGRRDRRRQRAAAPATGTTVRVSGGQRRVEDGPYADTKEQLGGFIGAARSTRWTPRSTGRRAARRRPPAPSRSGRS